MGNIKPIYTTTDFRSFLRGWIENFQGRGPISRIAEATGVSSSMVSQILKGSKTFTSEQVADLADFIGLTEQESEYLHLLVELDRAGTENLRRKIRGRIAKKTQEIRRISNIALKDKELSETLLAEYYSSWLYAAARQYFAVWADLDLNSLAKYLGISFNQAQRIFDFLLSNGLVSIRSQKVYLNSGHFHLSSDSPLVVNHHQNWRAVGLHKMAARQQSDMYYTSPMTLSAEDAEKITSMIPQFIEQVLKVVGPSKSEELRCLNIDWFRW